MTPPVVSCIVPVWNGERYLREALESIRAQTYRPLELIVADDGSTDGTAAVVADFEQVTYRWQPNAGPPAARNLGLSAATGAFVAFLDADDLWHPEKLARQMARFEARPALDLCVTHVRNFWAPEFAEEAARYRDHPRLTQAMPGYVTGTLLARRVLFEAVGGFNPTLQHGDSTEWFLRAAEHGAVMELLPDVLLSRRLHEGNRTRYLGSASRDRYLDIVKTSLDRRRRQEEERTSVGVTRVIPKPVEPDAEAPA